jgi:endoglucanase
VIGFKPVHLLEPEERNSNMKQKSLYIDIGADKKEEAEKLAPLGEQICFFSEYTEFGESCVKAKALDDRAGCAILLEALKEECEYDLYACFTVQEEVGLRGSGVAAYAVQPDIAFIFEGTASSNVAGVPEHLHSTRLGEGPVLTVMDMASYGDKGLFNFVAGLAAASNIKTQVKQTVTGGNDAGRIQQQGKGVKVLSISMPCRYIHSPVSVMSLKDFENGIRLARLIIQNLDSYVRTNLSGGEKHV